MTPEQLEAIKERATDLLMERFGEHFPGRSREEFRATVDLHVKVLDQATTDVLGHDALVEHDYRVGLPGWRRVQE